MLAVAAQTHNPFLTSDLLDPLSLIFLQGVVRALRVVQPLEGLPLTVEESDKRRSRGVSTSVRAPSHSHHGRPQLVTRPSTCDHRLAWPRHPRRHVPHALAHRRHVSRLAPQIAGALEKRHIGDIAPDSARMRGRSPSRLPPNNAISQRRRADNLSSMVRQRALKRTHNGGRQSRGSARKPSARLGRASSGERASHKGNYEY